MLNVRGEGVVDISGSSSRMYIYQSMKSQAGFIGAVAIGQLPSSRKGFDYKVGANAKDTMGLMISGTRIPASYRESPETCELRIDDFMTGPFMTALPLGIEYEPDKGILNVGVTILWNEEYSNYGSYKITGEIRIK